MDKELPLFVRKDVEFITGLEAGNPTSNNK
jgi:hypothetical protein